MNVVEKLSKDLVEQKIVTSEQLREAEKIKAQTGRSLGETLISLNYLTQDELISLISSKLDIPHIDLTSYVVESEVINLVPENSARRYKLFPLFRVEDTLTVAMADPMNIFALDDLKIQTGLNVEPAMASEESIIKAINEYYSGAHLLEEAAENIKLDLGDEAAGKLTTDRIEHITELPPIVKLVNQIILEAVKDRASDIHLEPHREAVDVRYRIDGILHKVSSIPKALHLPVVSRIKIWANLDISEKRIPQDGRIQTKIGLKDVDLRVSTFPAINGEKVVLRVLDKSGVSFQLSDLGFSAENLRTFRSLIKRPSGLVFITGPTGSGKTTTLYAALNAVISPERNIVTLEDPVEYEIKFINQGQINPKAGLTFAAGLRAILRQDPDIIMVGEVRDFETAELVIRAALTGHLVFSTLHTMDAASTITRLIDIGVEPFLIASSVAGIIAQRLVRKNCFKCVQEYSPPQKLVNELSLDNSSDLKFYWGKGCKDCGQTGYKGRTGLFEVVRITEPIKALIMEGAPAGKIKETASREGFKSLQEDGREKITKGITTVEEVLRATFIED